MIILAISILMIEIQKLIVVQWFVYNDQWHTPFANYLFLSTTSRLWSLKVLIMWDYYWKFLLLTTNRGLEIYLAQIPRSRLIIKPDIYEMSCYNGTVIVEVGSGFSNYNYNFVVKLLSNWFTIYISIYCKLSVNSLTLYDLLFLFYCQSTNCILSCS